MHGGCAPVHCSTTGEMPVIVSVNMSIILKIKTLLEPWPCKVCRRNDNIIVRSFDLSLSLRL